MTQMQTVLIIEPDPSIRGAMADVAHEAGYRCLEAGDGDEGLRLFGHARMAHVFVDVLAPGTDGLEVIRSLRALANGGGEAGRVTVTALMGESSFGDLGLLRVARLMGADHTVTKFPPLGHTLVTLGRILAGEGTRLVEKRMHRRYARSLTGMVHWYHEAVSSTVECTVLNLSLGGALLRTRCDGRAVPQPGADRFELVLRDEDGYDEVFPCEPRRLEHDGEHVFIGTAFSTLHARQKKTLRTCLAA
ncbi:MAG: response regulator [Desulfovibrionaceae bacterium]|jgi:CheY-like chemotaxis protein|nr:response regulator [Desulfovibrionaceae bacterium]